MAGKEKNEKSGFFSLRNSVFLLIIFTCLLAIWNTTLEILFYMQVPQIIEVTREVPVTQSYNTGFVPPTATYPYGQSTCNAESFKAAFESGGEYYFDCNNVILFDEPLVISNSVHIHGSSELLTTLSQSQNLTALFIIQSGGSLTLENIAIREFAGTVLDIQEGGNFTATNCRIANNGSIQLRQPLIRVAGTMNVAQCVFEGNTLNSALIRVSATGYARIASTTFRGNILSSGDYMGQADLIDNYGTMHLNTAYFIDNHFSNSVNNLIRNGGTMDIFSGLIRNNTIELQGNLLMNETNAVLNVSNMSFPYNAITQGYYLNNSGNLRMSYIGLFVGACHNTGVLNDLSRTCG